jgi:hypothetical protein
MVLPRRHYSTTGKPAVGLLTAVRPPYEQARHSFHSGCGVQLRAERQHIIDWAIASAIRPQLAAAKTTVLPLRR